MSKAPSVKGSVFVGVVETVKKLLAEGELTRETAARYLEPADFALFDAQLSIASWYDIRVYDRFNRLLFEVVGGSDPDYMRQLGRESARRVRSAGVYSQMDYVDRMQQATHDDPTARFEAFGRDLRLMQSMTGSIYNFIKWTLQQDPEHPLRYRIVWTDGGVLSDLNCLRAEGFCNEMASGHRHADLWTSQRVGKDVIVFRMSRDL